MYFFHPFFFICHLPCLLPTSIILQMQKASSSSPSHYQQNSSFTVLQKSREKYNRVMQQHKREVNQLECKHA